MKIACLHSAESNIGIFEDSAIALRLAPGTLSHVVRADLLLAAERTGGLTPGIEGETSAALIALCSEADAVLLTCSTLGPSVMAAAAASKVPILRVDAALAAEAVRRGGKVIALCAVETTLGPTSALFAAAAMGTDTTVETRLVPGAWALFRAGDHKGYWTEIARAVEQTNVGGATTVALAQASMAGAVDFVTRGPKPLASPTVGLAAAQVAAKLRTN